MAASPTIVLDTNSSSFRNSPPDSQKFITFAYQHMISDPRYALACLNQVIRNPITPNPLVYEAFRMRGKIALDHNLHAEACVFFELAADFGMVVDPARGSPAENQPVFEENMAIVQHLKRIIRQPRMLDIPPRNFDTEANFQTCHVESLGFYAMGQKVPMPDINNPAALAFFRQTLGERYTIPLGAYLVLPTQGEPYSVWPTQGCTALIVPGQRVTQFRTHGIYNDDLVERAMGNERGFPEGHFYRIFEAIMHSQSPQVVAANRLARNELATILLQTSEVIYGPVLVQMCYLLKHSNVHLSLVAVRESPAAAFLRSSEWVRMRMEFRALVCNGLDDGLHITLLDVARKNAEAALLHVHAQ